MFKQRLLLKTFNPDANLKGNATLQAIRAQTSSVTTDCLQQAALLASSFLFSTIENKGSS